MNYLICLCSLPAEISDNARILITRKVMKKYCIIHKLLSNYIRTLKSIYYHNLIQQCIVFISVYGCAISSFNVCIDSKWYASNVPVKVVEEVYGL